MGAKESQPSGQIQNDPTINHPRFRNSKLIQNKDREDMLEVKVTVPNENEYNQWVNALKEIPIHSENYLVPESYEFSKEGFCGSSGFVTIIFKNFPFLLIDEIQNRKPKVNRHPNSVDSTHDAEENYFDEAELWYLVFSLIEAGHEFHEKGKKVGDVRSENVFINEDGQVKVATQFTWPTENTNYHKTFYEKETTYLAPEELKDIIFAKMEPSGDFRLAESFSIGLTCLDAATLSSSNELYQKNSKLNYEDLSRRLQNLRNVGYSEVLNLVIANLCEADYERRSSCSELYTWLEPYQEAIINLEPFEATNLPHKIAQNSHFVQSQNQLQNQNFPQPSSIPNHGQQLDQGPQTYTQQNYIPSHGQDQRVTYTHTYQHQPQTQTQSQTQPERIIMNHPQQQQQSFPSNVTYVQYPSNQYHQSPNFPVGQNVISQPVYSHVGSRQQETSGDRPKTGMELTLEKIDEQLQMSRRMFPS